MLTGCAATNPLPARMYDLSEPEVVTIQLTNFRDGHGAMSGQLANGEKLVGDYTLSELYGDRVKPAAADKIKWSLAGNLFPGKDDPSWQQVYGYGDRTDVRPVGIGTMLGDKGTAMMLVFYFADVWKEVGSGVARSSAGHWYRFHVGAIPGSEKSPPP
jgi:hypothetical protein